MQGEHCNKRVPTGSAAVASAPDDDDKRFTELIDTLFFGARNITFCLPDMYRQTIMRAMLDFAMEQLYSGNETHKKIIHDTFEKWAGESAEAPESNDDDE